MVLKRGGSSWFQLVKRRYQALFTASSPPYLFLIQSRKRAAVFGQ